MEPIVDPIKNPPNPEHSPEPERHTDDPEREPVKVDQWSGTWPTAHDYQEGDLF